MVKPERFGKYLLVDCLSTGGMAAVYLGKSVGIGGFEKILAIKRILPSLSEDADFTTMFVDEANISASLSHANIGQVFDFGQHAGQYFIAMEYIPGKDLRTIQLYLKQTGRRIPIAMTLHVTSQLCQALDYAHRLKSADGRSMDIVHRDVSPPNVLISYDGSVKLIDFGIARAASRATRTRTGRLKGKFSYMSPEQVQGLTVDQRSDLFSLGILLHELLTNQRLFLGDNQVETMNLVRRAEVAAPSCTNPDVPLEVDRIVLKALARDRNERYQWASELRADLERFIGRTDHRYDMQKLAQWMRSEFADDVAMESERSERLYALRPQDVQVAEVARGAPVPPGAPHPPRPAPWPPQDAEEALSLRGADDVTRAEPGASKRASAGAAGTPVGSFGPAPPTDPYTPVQGRDPALGTTELPPDEKPDAVLEEEPVGGAADDDALEAEGRGEKTVRTPGPDLYAEKAHAAALSPRNAAASAEDPPLDLDEDEETLVGVPSFEEEAATAVLDEARGFEKLGLDGASVLASSAHREDEETAVLDAGSGEPSLEPARFSHRSAAPPRGPTPLPPPPAPASPSGGYEQTASPASSELEPPPYERTAETVQARPSPIAPGPERAGMVFGGALEIPRAPARPAPQVEAAAPVDLRGLGEGHPEPAWNPPRPGPAASRPRQSPSPAGGSPRVYSTAIQLRDRRGLQGVLERFNQTTLILMGAGGTLLLAGAIYLVVALLTGGGTPPNPAVGPSGSIVVTTTPPATCSVTLDGTPRGLLQPGASISLTQVPVGDHEVALQCAGFERFTAAATVRQAEASFVVAALKAKGSPP